MHLNPFKELKLPNKNILWYSRYKDILLGITYLKESGVYEAELSVRKDKECNIQQFRNREEAEKWLCNECKNYLEKYQRRYLED